MNQVNISKYPILKIKGLESYKIICKISEQCELSENIDIKLAILNKEYQRNIKLFFLIVLIKVNT